MKSLLLVSLFLLFTSGNAVAEGIGCPKDTTPNGEETPDGSEAWCETMKEGKIVMHGPYSTWHSNGKLRSKGQYEFGKAAGQWRGWYESGELQGEVWFQNGEKAKSRYLNKQGHEIPAP
jgi:antitoxin component YwqK of YwqJK toxin-antitoxin module